MLFSFFSSWNCIAYNLFTVETIKKILKIYCIVVSYTVYKLTTQSFENQR